MGTHRLIYLSTENVQIRYNNVYIDHDGSLFLPYYKGKSEHKMN
ncbi:hypothetical protein SAMN03159341_102488 [Paenibacillus sp. 1_12]|nr:hypothetical protein SAMN03159341_102488 [Paenibacillus sp. 1_12]